MGSDDAEVVRVLFQILERGDRLKMDGSSNVAPTGGGARDLRFRPASEFLPFFKKMLPKVVPKTRGATQIDTYRGSVSWKRSGQQKSQDMTVWPPTDTRPDECRIATINAFDFGDLVEMDPADDRSVFMLFQQRNGIVRVHFTTETSLHSQSWHAAIRHFARAWLATEHRSAFLDRETKEMFPA